MHLYQLILYYLDIFEPQMSRYVQKKANYQPHDEGSKGRFGFEYIKENINYRTEIPALPQKPKAKPDDKRKTKQLEQIEKRIAQMKEKRREKKDLIKKVNQSYDNEIQTIKANVDLGKKCIVVLSGDLYQIGDQIHKISSRINSKRNKNDDIIKDIRELKNQGRTPKKNDKTYEEMTNKELDEEKRRISHQMTIRTLSKKEESELNNILIKIGRLKFENKNVEESEVSKSNNFQKITALQADIQVNKNEIQKLTAERKKLFDQKQETQFKIDCIREDIQSFIDQIKVIAEKQEENEESKQLYKEAAKIKEQIYAEREKKNKIQTQFLQKVKDYETEQEKIKWIHWASKIQDEKRQEWEQEKAERKRQKLKERQYPDKKQTGKPEQDPKGQKKFEERKVFNKNQKQIDTCSFLLDYCKRLYPQSNTKNQQNKKQVNIQDQLKKGQWAKEKGVEIVQSKKAKRDEQQAPKTHGKKKQQQKQQEIITPNRFSHDYFVAQSFDIVKILPPTNVEQLDKIVKDLEDKIEYYLSHPEQIVERKFAQDKKFIDKNSKGSYEDKNTKSKPNKKVINTEEFPSLA